MIGSAHYKKTKIEAWDVIKDWKLNFNLGNVIKYIARQHAVRKKKRDADLIKAFHYLAHEIIERDLPLAEKVASLVSGEKYDPF